MTRLKMHSANIMHPSTCMHTIIPLCPFILTYMRLRGWLHVCDFMCDLLHIADAIWCICDFVFDKNHFLSFFCTKSQMRFDVDAIWCICDFVFDKNHFICFFCTKSQMRFHVDAIWCLRFRVFSQHGVNGGDSVSDTKS
jgi:hypothetical protein